MRGVDHAEDPGQGKLIFNVSLKRGWNKIKHYRADMRDFAKYAAVHIYEATFEKGLFEFYYFDFDDYLNDESVQFATLEGTVVVVKKEDGDDFWFLLEDPIRIRDHYYDDDEVRDVYKVLLFVDPRTFPRSGNYVLFGEIDHFTTEDGDVIFSVVEIKEER
jgi:hypothetical protein